MRVRLSGDLNKLTKQVLIADGSRFDLASDVMWALKSNPNGKYNCRVDLLLDLGSDL